MRRRKYRSFLTCCSWFSLVLVPLTPTWHYLTPKSSPTSHILIKSLAVPVTPVRMPPIPIRQSPSIPGVPRPSTDSAKEPIPGTKYISLRVMLELLAGTLAIFIIGVLAWKLGRFIRSFTRKRVLQGNAPTARYARTWYGWVPLQRHERNRDLAQTCLQRLCGWTTWSSKADYRWVWWDPGSKELQRHNEKRKLRRWLPRSLRSRSFVTADDIWNPVLRGPASKAGTYVCSAGVLEGLVPSSDIIFSREAATTSAAKGRDSTVDESRDSETEFRGHLRRGLGRMWYGGFSRGRYSADDAHFRRWRTAWTSQLDYISKKNKRRSSATNAYLISKKSRSLPCLLAANVFQQQHQRPNRTSCAGTPARRSASHSPLQVLRHSRKYQVWSARMQLRTPYCVKNGSLGPLVPPGSPISDILASISSHQASLLDLAKLDKKRSSVSSDMVIYRHARRHRRTSSILTRKPAMTDGAGKRCLAPGQNSLAGVSPHNRQTLSCIDDDPWTSSRSVECAPTCEHKRFDKKSNGSSAKDIPEIKIPIRILSDWEIRSIYALSCRLEWLANQLNPGRRPFHFAMLPNHWMNKRTWIVYDPPCRVSIDARRRLGDTRFFTAYPMPDWTPKLKYPQPHRKVVHRPRIDSWRNAVNRRRKSLGLTSFVKTIELYESSGEYPPDGKVDPASWMLRRPPQGVGPPRNQENVYYEGGTGWQETYRDWQRVPHGYRVRKMIHEGRINRNRVKEVALSVSRRCTTRGARSRQNRRIPGGPIQELTHR